MSHIPPEDARPEPPPTSAPAPAQPDENNEDSPFFPRTPVHIYELDDLPLTQTRLTKEEWFKHIRARETAYNATVARLKRLERTQHRFARKDQTCAYCGENMHDVRARCTIEACPKYREEKNT